MQQLEENKLKPEGKKLTWKGYFEDLPSHSPLVIYDPSDERPDSMRPSQLYASKHNGFINFDYVRKDPQIADKIVGLEQLDSDLTNGQVPNYAHIVFNQCNDMHGLSKAPNHPSPDADCIAPPSPTDGWDQIIGRSDKKVGEWVDRIMASSAWSASSNAAIVITWDEDNSPPDKTAIQGCCGSESGSLANFGGGHIPTIVITNHGPRHALDPMPYNHYSLLRTCEEAFGLDEYLGLAAAKDKGVRSMKPLFAISAP